MRILFLAPHPFFQERGTPIAVRLALKVLAARNADTIDLVTYAEGTDVQIPGVNMHRIWSPRFLHGVRPGFSLKKVICDIILALKALQLTWSHRHTPYQIIHAVEESVFIAWVLKKLFRIPYVYDMDSSLALQLTEKYAIFRLIGPVLHSFERLAIRGSVAVVPVCEALAALAASHGSDEVHTLHDISLLENSSENRPELSLREEIDPKCSQRIILYVGNMESYQGVDLLLRSFAEIAAHAPEATLVLVGGAAAHIEHYKRVSQTLGIAKRTHFLGPRPVSRLYFDLVDADILVSPRTQGNNTPMKLYSYLHAGRALVATNLPTHTQVVTHETAELADPTPQAFGAALLTLIRNEQRRAELGQAARSLAEKRYTFPAFEQRLNEIYDRVASLVSSERGAIGSS